MYEPSLPVTAVFESPRRPRERDLRARYQGAALIGYLAAQRCRLRDDLWRNCANEKQ
jgi:hypothetical protein